MHARIKFKVYGFVNPRVPFKVTWFDVSRDMIACVVNLSRVQLYNMWPIIDLIERRT